MLVEFTVSWLQSLVTSVAFAPFMSAGFKAESARDFYDCAAASWHRQPT